jgi:serine/threonine protein kinase
MAPELYEDADHGKVDVFSFALILYEIMACYPLFSAELSLPQLTLKVAKEESADIPRRTMPFVQDLIRKEWSSDPAERPSFKNIFENLRGHEFCIIQEGFDRNEVASYIEWIGRSSTA